MELVGAWIQGLGLLGQMREGKWVSCKAHAGHQ